MSVLCTKIHYTKMESSTLVYIQVSRVRKNTESQNTWCNMATREERLTKRREHDRLRIQMETAGEREARFI